MNGLLNFLVGEDEDLHKLKFSNSIPTRTNRRDRITPNVSQKRKRVILILHRQLLNEGDKGLLRECVILHLQISSYFLRIPCTVALSV